MPFRLEKLLRHANAFMIFSFVLLLGCSHFMPKPKNIAVPPAWEGVEAASKSLKEPTSTKIDDFVENIISKQIESDQFLNANITFKEIQSIKKVLKHKLANIYHLRIEYPE